MPGIVCLAHMVNSAIDGGDNKKRTSVYCVHVDANQMILLVKDAHSLQWGFPGGGLEPGEAHDDALHREFTEETGMVMRGASTYITRQDSETWQRYFYKIEIADGHLQKQGNDDDILEAAYFGIKDLPSDLAPGVEEIVIQQIGLSH